MQNGVSASVLIEAIDATGGPMPGSWTAAGTGPFTVVLDSAFQSTSAGSLGNGRKFNITPATEGDGSITFTGTGGQLVVPIRIAPSALGLNLAFSSPTPVNDTLTIPLNATVTATATPGTRFTSTTAVRMMTGPLTTDASFFAVKNFSISSDSLSLTFLPGPNSSGHMEVSGIASVSTPTLKSTARTHTTMVTDIFDTNSTNRLVLAATPAAIGDTVTVTLPATYRFSPNTGITHITDTIINGTASRVTTNGLAAPLVVSVSADSGTFKYIPAPGASGRPRFSNLRVRANAALWAFAARTSGIYAMPSIVLAATYGPSNSVATNVPVTITMPAGFKLRPNSTVSYPGSPLPVLILGRAADSSSITILPSQNVATSVVLDSLLFNGAPAFKLTMPTTTKLTTANTIDVGPDDPAASHVFAAPTVTGTSVGWLDKYTMSVPDPTCDGAPGGAQFYTLTVSVSGNYRIQGNWSSGSDFDFGILLKDGTYGPSCSNYLSTAGLASSKPEVVASVALTAGQTYVIDALDFGEDGSGIVQIMVTKIP